jgi:hypothetical protein
VVRLETRDPILGLSWLERLHNHDTCVDRLGSPGCYKREGVSEMASGIVSEAASGNTSEVMSEVISGIPSGIISGIQGPQLLQHFQDLYQVAWRQDYIGSDTVLPRRKRETCVYSRSHKLLKKPRTKLKLPVSGQLDYWATTDQRDSTIDTIFV